MVSGKRRNDAEKVKIFSQFFTGLTHVYGTYDVQSGRAYQVKRPVTNEVFLAHLKGQQPYGVYLLLKDQTKAMAADFDTNDSWLPTQLVLYAKSYNVPAYIVRSKNKGYHVFVFFDAVHGVKAAKARLVMRHFLEAIDGSKTEIFPKHDSLDTDVNYGNFINAPLFGALVPQGRTVFVDHASLSPYPDQWSVLENIDRVAESALDEIVDINELDRSSSVVEIPGLENRSNQRFNCGLPPCAKTMLKGVTQNQRVVCFRLAVHLKKTGLPNDMAIEVLKVWATKNKPAGNRRIITTQEIVSQAFCAYEKGYRGCGCEDPTIEEYCSQDCPIKRHQYGRSDQEDTEENREEKNHGNRNQRY